MSRHSVRYWRISRHFVETEGSLQCSQQLSTGPYPEPDESSPYPYTISLRFILILSTHLHLGLPSGLFSSGSPTKTLYEFLFSPCVLHAQTISSSLTWSFQFCLVTSTSYEAPRYAIFLQSWIMFSAKCQSVICGFGGIRNCKPVMYKYSLRYTRVSQ
jgi:hypothetical protein